MATTTTNFDIKEIGSGWDVRNLNIDPPVVKFIYIDYPDDPEVISNGWHLESVTGNSSVDAALIFPDGTCTIGVNLYENQPVNAFESCNYQTEA